jgi:hypothetical protein
MKNILFFSLIVLLASCEDVIEIDLKNTESRIVIEGTISDLGNGCTIKISKTVDYFKPGTYPAVSSAIVSVSDYSGNTFNFTETESGIYYSDNFRATENTAYLLTIDVENQIFEATVTLPEKVNIDFLSFEETPLFLDFKGGYVVNCHLQDPFEQTNYYRLKAYNINDSEKANASKYLFDDYLTEGNNFFMQWDIEQFQLGDTVVVEMQNLDKSTYEFYKTLFLLGDNVFGSSNPANPKTNLTNNALGFFGAYAISRDTIIIKQ